MGMYDRWVEAGRQFSRIVGLSEISEAGFGNFPIDEEFSERGDVRSD